MLGRCGRFGRFLKNSWTRTAIAGVLLGLMLVPVVQAAAWTLNVPAQTDAAKGDTLYIPSTAFAKQGRLQSLAIGTTGQTLCVVSAAPAWCSSTSITGIAGVLNVVGNFSVATTVFTVNASTGAVAFTGALTGATTWTNTGNVVLGDAAGDAHGTLGTFYYRRKYTLSTTTGAQTALAATDCGSIQEGAATSSTQTYTLPAVSGNAGCTITFIAGHADTEILINSAASATCVITTFAAVGTDADTQIVTDTSCSTGLKNTAATNAIGDTITLVTNGTVWYGIGITSGIWAAQ